MKYRKKPVVIEAIQFKDGKFVGEAPYWIDDAALGGKLYREGPSIFIVTLEGEMECSSGDWIIQGVQGELYPCKPDIFEQTYEPVTTATSPDTKPGDASLERSSGPEKDI